MNNFKFIVLLVTILGSSSLFAQVYNVNFAPLNFSANNQTLITSYLGNSSPTPNTASGAKTLYTNVITINGQRIDCIVSNNGNISVLDADWRSNTSVAPGNTTDALRVDSMFSPVVTNSPSQNYQTFNFFFCIASTSNSGSTINSIVPVILDNVVLNIYDLDRDGGTQGNLRNRVRISNDNYKTFEALSSQIAYNNDDPNVLDFYQGGNASSNAQTSYSTIISNDNRYRFTFSNLTTFDISLGEERVAGNSTNWTANSYFYLAFSRGTGFNSVVVENLIIVDLNGSNSVSVNNEVIVNNNNAYNFTVGTPNVSTTNTTLTGFNISYQSNKILNGSDERMIINSSSGPIVIDLSSPSGTTFSLSTLNYTMSSSTSGGVVTFNFTHSGGNLTLAQGEALLDALQYQNLSTQGDEVGFREFTVIGIGTYSLNSTTYTTLSPPAIFIVNISTPLPVNILSFTGKAIAAGNQLNWTVAQEDNFSHYEVLRSDNGRDFNAVGTVYALNNSLDMKSYSFVDADAKSDLSYYKLRLVDNNGSVAYSSLVVVSRTNIVPTVSNVFPNPASTQLNVELNGVATDNMTVTIQDLTGKILYQAENVSAQSSVYSFDINTLNRGVYIIRIQDEMGQTTVSRFSVSK